MRLQKIGSKASVRVLQRKDERSGGRYLVAREASNRGHRQSSGARPDCCSYLAMGYWSPIVIRLYDQIFKVCRGFVLPRPDLTFFSLNDEATEQSCPTITYTTPADTDPSRRRRATATATAAAAAVAAAARANMLVVLLTVDSCALQIRYRRSPPMRRTNATEQTEPQSLTLCTHTVFRIGCSREAGRRPQYRSVSWINMM